MLTGVLSAYRAAVADLNNIKHKAPKDADNPNSGPGDSKQNYEHEFPSLLPTSEPDVNRSDVDGKTLNGDDKDGGHDDKDSDDDGVRSPTLQMNGQNGSPSGILQTGTTLAGNPTRGPRSLSFAAAGVDGNIDSSSSELWDPPGVGGRVAKRKRYNNPSRPSKRSANGSIWSHRHWRGSPVSFGDDLDERSETEEEEFGCSGDGDNEEATGWKIRLAPWNTPMHRRLQTLAVLMHCLGMGLTFSLFCFLCTIPLLWPILIAYLIYIRVSTAGTDGITTHRIDAFRKARVWRYFAAYYPARLHKTADLPPTRKYILAVHPHGIISHGAWAAFATEALGFSQLFPGITNSLCTLNGNFKTPFYREYLLAMGLQSVSRESITNLLTKGGANGEGMGRAVSIVIGGAREALEAQPKTMRLIVSRRGFCRMALRTGADLVPVLAFGENDLYRQWSQRDHPKFRRLQMKLLALMGFSVPVLQGRGVFNYDFGILPHRRPLNIVVGAPIKVRQLTGSSREEEAAAIEALHKVYLEKLVELYDEYKDVYFKDRKEEIQFVV